MSEANDEQPPARSKESLPQKSSKSNSSQKSKSKESLSQKSNTSRKSKENEIPAGQCSQEPCTWEENFCMHGVSQTILAKFFNHFCSNHNKAMSMLQGLKQAATESKATEDLFDKYGKCSDAYTMIQFLTFMYTENAQFKALVDEFNMNAKNNPDAAAGMFFQPPFTSTPSNAPPMICSNDPNLFNGVSQQPNRISFAKECVQPPSPSNFGSRSRLCDNPSCLKSEPVDNRSNASRVLCENADCPKNLSKPKTKVCRVYISDSTESFQEEQEKADNSEPSPVHEYFDCFPDKFCEKSLCYPCHYNVNDEVIKKYVDEYLDSLNNPQEEKSVAEPPPDAEAAPAVESPPDGDRISQKSKSESCKCEAFRQYFIDKRKREQKEEAIKEAVAKCPCEQCPELKEEDDAQGEPKPPKVCNQPCTPCVTEEPEEEEEEEEKKCAADEPPPPTQECTSPCNDRAKKDENDCKPECKNNDPDLDSNAEIEDCTASCSKLNRQN